MAYLESKIGNVRLVIESSAEDATYADAAEERLLALFERPDAEAERERILENNPDWPMFYHLSYARENLLNWYPFDSRQELLEIGAGCGAVTGLFARKLGHVTALELTSRRGRITAMRHRQYPNLEVVVNNLLNFKPDRQYDIVTSIGVLEYAGTYINDEKPFKKFLDIAYGMLKPGGTLMVAIENKLGLKYWAGAHEDHTGRPFEGIEGYPHKKGIRTFGRKELAKLLEASGFEEQMFYFPLPDYKIPVEVISDTFTPEEGSPIDSSLFPAPGNDRERDHILFESLALRSLIENGLFRDFVNSFLVIAKREQ